MMWLKFLIWILASLGCVTNSFGDATQGEVIFLKAGRLMDVRSGTVQSNQFIRIEGDRIAEVGPLSAMPTNIPSGTKIIDLSNATVLPGLIDSHTHLTSEPGQYGFESLGFSIPRETLFGVKNARITLNAGFTTVRNVGAGGFSDIALRDAVVAGDIEGPRIVACGPAISPTGGHGDVNELAPEFHYTADGVADGVPGVIQKTREIIKYGADCIKLVATGGTGSKNTSPNYGAFSDEELLAIVTEAHRLGRKVAAHAHGAVGIKQAVKAGVDSIEHATGIDEEAIELMKQHKTYLIPTIYLREWRTENAKKIGLPDYIIQKAEEVKKVAYPNLERAFHSGVSVAFGTDAAVYPHGLNGKEFAILVKLGLTPLQAIQAATIHAADLLGRSDSVGSLEKGYYADIVAVAGDPLKNISIFEDVGFVMKGGQVYKNNLAK
jgi:imidazolonepropionase-like amidohydrolase